MLIRIPRSSDPKASEITSESQYLSRRDWIRNTGMLGAGLALGSASGSLLAAPSTGWKSLLTDKLSSRGKIPDTTGETLTPFEDATRYNNFYEFGTGKSDPVENSGKFRVDPWTVSIEGAVSKPLKLNLEDLLKPHALEER
ncbi:MAG TPA: mononuclear molybdenum enzyme YedY, partial [Candidatus Kapabacteria bacterium]|nr:mononuclear molybdenum enzyme YedY [Candidatus Kapabacteria bacterium]